MSQEPSYPLGLVVLCYSCCCSQPRGAGACFEVLLQLITDWKLGVFKHLVSDKGWPTAALLCSMMSHHFSYRITSLQVQVRHGTARDHESRSFLALRCWYSGTADGALFFHESQVPGMIGCAVRDCVVLSPARSCAL